MSREPPSEWQDWMDDPEFWAIVELRDPDAITRRFAELSAERLGTIYWRAHHMAIEATEEPYASAMGIGSEDGIYDVACFFIQQGKATYADYLAHPEKYRDSVHDESWDLQSLALTVFEERFDEEIDEYEPED